MVPYDYRTFISTLRDEVNAGRVPLSRIDDAVTRILTKKFELGLFERPFADRSFTAGVGSRGAPRPRAPRGARVARPAEERRRHPAAREDARRGSSSPGRARTTSGTRPAAGPSSGRGGSGDIIPGTTILRAIRDTVAPGTTVTYSRDASGLDRSYDVAIVVVGETAVRGVVRRPHRRARARRGGPRDARRGEALRRSDRRDPRLRPAARRHGPAPGLDGPSSRRGCPAARARASPTCSSGTSRRRASSR